MVWKKKVVLLFVVLALFVETTPLFVVKAGQCFPWAL